MFCCEKKIIFFSSFRIFFLPISEKSTDRLNIVVLHCTRWMHLFFPSDCSWIKKKNCFLNSLFELFSRYNNNNVLHIENPYIERVQSHLIWFMNFFFFSLSSYLVYLTLNAYDGEEKKTLTFFFFFGYIQKGFFTFFCLFVYFFKVKVKKWLKWKWILFSFFEKAFFHSKTFFPGFVNIFGYCWSRKQKRKRIWFSKRFFFFFFLLWFGFLIQSDPHTYWSFFLSPSILYLPSSLDIFFPLFFFLLSEFLKTRWPSKKQKQQKIYSACLSTNSVII